MSQFVDVAVEDRLLLKSNGFVRVDGIRAEEFFSTERMRIVVDQKYFCCSTGSFVRKGIEALLLLSGSDVWLHPDCSRAGEQRVIRYFALRYVMKKELPYFGLDYLRFHHMDLIGRTKSPEYEITPDQQLSWI